MVPKRDVGTNNLARYSLHAEAVQLLVQGKELAAPKTTPEARLETYQDYKRTKQAADTLTPQLDTPPSSQQHLHPRDLQRHAL